MITFYDEITKDNTIYIYPPFSNEYEVYKIPNSYFINSDGLLFNTFGDNSHKETNLIYTYNLIKDYYLNRTYTDLFGNKNISIYDVLVDEINTYKRIKTTNKLTSNDIKKYIHLNCANLDDPLLIKLILGIISSKIILLDKFNNLNKNDLFKILSEANDDLVDILVRFCGFHKIESTMDKVITTSSLNLNNFINYLERDYIINIIPKIYLDYKRDLLYEDLVINNFILHNPCYEGQILKKI